MFSFLTARRSSVLIGLLWLLGWSLQASAQSPVPVEVITVEARPVTENLEVTGSVVSPRRALLSPAIAGLVQSVNVNAGDLIEQGDRILALDAELAELALRRAQAAAAEAEAARLEAQRRFDEAAALDSSAIPATEVRSRQAAVDVAAASLQAARATVAERQAELNRHVIRAPFAGAVVSRAAESGEWVAPGEGVIELLAVDELWFDFQLPQAYLNRVDDNTDIQVTLEALPGQSFPASLEARVPVTDASARTFLLRLTAEGAAGAGAVPGMSARARLALGTGRSAPVVPRDAVLRYPDGRITVWVVDGDGSRPVVRERRVQLGVESASGLEIEDGLEAGETVVVRGNESLRDGLQVRIQP